MEDITAATGTVKGKIVYPDGNGPGLATYIPFSFTISDNCCEGHAKEQARWLVEKAIEANNERKKKFPFLELSVVQWDD